MDECKTEEVSKKRWKDKLLSVTEGEINRKNLESMVHKMCVTAFNEHIDSSELASRAALSFGKLLASLFLTFPHVEGLIDDSEEGQDEKQD